jgi:hypothetical protein
MYNSRWPEQEMDFTAYQTTQTPTIGNIASANGDQQSYLRANAVALKAMPASTSPMQMFNTGPFDFSQIVAMDSNTVSPLEISSSSSVRTDSYISLKGESPEHTGTAPQRSQALAERLCPLITGDTETCEPSKCGPDAPCMNFTNLPPIEECASAPCISLPENSVPVSSTSPSTARMSTRTKRPSTNKIQSTSTLPPATNERKYNPPTSRRLPLTSRSSQHPNKPAVIKLDKKQRAKQAHSLVEKKYRENLNTKLSQLYTTLQNAHYGPNRYASNDSDIDLDELNDDGDAPISSLSETAAGGSIPKFRKSEVLDNAMTYVNQTEVEMRHMENEILRLGERVKQLESLAKCQADDCSMMKRLGLLQVQAPS